MSTKAILVIIFNHRYDKNIPILEALYRPRFRKIYFLVPFYDGTHPDVIPVFESSHRFQGYIAQGARDFIAEEFAHCIFIGDDLILNPGIDEDNYRDHFGLDESSGFIPEVFSLHDLTNNKTLGFEPFLHRGKTKQYWWRVRQAVEYKHPARGVEPPRDMPDRQEAERRIRAHGFAIQPLTFIDLHGPFPALTSPYQARLALRYLYGLRHYRRHYFLNYPLVAAYSDIVVVPRISISDFCRYCGVFAANSLFVEIAIPTALLLSCKKVQMEPTIGRRGGVYWNYTPAQQNEMRMALEPYGNDFDKLMSDFPDDRLYIHPIKLSKWKTSSLKVADQV